MNDASSSGPSTNPPEASPSTDNEASTARAAAAAADAGLTPEQQKESIQKAQKIAFFNHLIRDLDITIFCQLSILYYMDCSLFNFILRALPQWYFFTPKPDILRPPHLLFQGPYIGAIFGSSLICILLHLFFSPPAAGEAARGYLHGGVIIDFVGQASPVSSLRLLGLDVLCLVLQVVVMCLTLEKLGLEGRKKPIWGVVDAGALDVLAGQQGRRSRDLDAEERGMLSSDYVGDMEMQDLGHALRGRAAAEDNRERDELLAHELQEEERDEHPLDAFYAGDHVLVKLHLWDTVRTQWRTSGVRTIAPANAATTTAGMQIAAGGYVGRRIAFTWATRSAGEG